MALHLIAHLLNVIQQQAPSRTLFEFIVEHFNRGFVADSQLGNRLCFGRTRQLMDQISNGVTPYPDSPQIRNVIV